MADDDDEWRFSVDEVGPDDPDDGDDMAGDDPPPESTDGDEWVTVVGEDDDGPTVELSSDATDEDGNVAGTLAPDATVEPGTPDLENAVFATAGAILTVLVFAGVFVPLDPVTVGSLAAAVVAGAALLYVFFRRF